MIRCSDMKHSQGATDIEKNEADEYVVYCRADKVAISYVLHMLKVKK